MDRTLIQLYDVAGKTELPDISVENIPADGDPIEIDGEMYFVCERNTDVDGGTIPSIGVIPLVVRNPAKVSNIEEYVRCLSMAHRKVLFKKNDKLTDLRHSDEMIIE